MAERTAVVFGAGKIARGFIAHLLTLSGYRIVFVEKSRELVRLLRERGRYKVQILGAPEKDISIGGFEVIGSDEEEEVARAVARADVVFISIGGPNLPAVAPLLAGGIRHRAAGLNIILAENYFQPARWLRGLIAESLGPEEAVWFRGHVGIVETMVLRSTIEPTEEMKAEDPLSLKAQDMWEMPADKEAFIGEVLPIRGLAPKEDFQGGLIKKLFTYNAINAVIAYCGYLKGHELLGDAANDPELADLATAAGRESSEALCRRYGWDPDDQRRFAEGALAKYRKREIVDPIERNARDPIRKLARNDRLVGPACLAMEQGVRPEALSLGIAAALRYDAPGDPAARKLQGLIAGQGPAGALRGVCGIDPESDLGAMVLDLHRELAAGWPPRPTPLPRRGGERAVPPEDQAKG
jgi:mannitol-1-phosphate 5-dehydrogenase